MQSDKEGGQYRGCVICGKRKGRGTDHTKCAKKKQEMYAGSSETKKPKKTRSNKEMDSVAMFYRDK